MIDLNVYNLMLQFPLTIYNLYHILSIVSLFFLFVGIVIVAEFFYVTIASVVDNGVQAPLFLQEPISELMFSNESGSQISCSAHGNPSVTWVQKDGSPISSVPGLRYIIYNHIIINIPHHL